MARRRSSRQLEQREGSVFANAPLLRSLPVNVGLRSPLLSYSDRREYHPDDFFAPLYSSSVFARDVVDKNVNKAARSVRFRSPFMSTPTRLGVRIPNKVALCVRRKVRREVIFAKRKFGAGSRARFRRRNYWSEVSC